MARSKYPYHLRSNKGKRTICGNWNGVDLPVRSIKRVECKNCLKIIRANRETSCYLPLDPSIVAKLAPITGDSMKLPKESK